MKIKKISVLLIFSLLLFLLIAGVSAANDNITNEIIQDNIGESISESDGLSCIDEDSELEDSNEEIAVPSKDSKLEDSNEEITASSQDSELEDSNGEYIDASEAYTYLNAFRTESNVWQWDDDDTTKSHFNGNDTVWLYPLERDIELEETAKIRAKEISQYYDHVRPDGTMCFTIFPDGLLSMGENIAAGYFTAQSVTEAWKETNDDYSGQGHRRNMLNPSFNRVGIAGYKLNGITYWVQDFGTRNDPKDFDSSNSFSFESNVENPQFSIGIPIYGTGYFLVKVDGNEIAYKELFQGKANSTIYGLSPGSHSVELVYMGDNNYKSVNKTEIIEVLESTIENPSFSYLNTLIKMGGSVVKLEKDYVYDSNIDDDFNRGIVVSKSITIDGQGHSIDAKGLARIFEPNAYGVTFKNIRFINGYTKGFGGAIYSSYYYFSIVNSTFINNSARYYGGAVYSHGSLVIENSTFINNTATLSGGAVYGEMYVSSTNSNFTENHASDLAGAIYSGTRCVAKNSVFTRNTNTQVLAKGEFVNNNSIFINDEAVDYFANVTVDYGILNMDRNINLTQTVIVNGSNVIIEGNGYTIGGQNRTRIFYITGNNVTIRNINFANASSSGYGGAIYVNGTDFKISNAIFENCIAEQGGAIYISLANATVTDSRFLNNSAVDFTGQEMAVGGAIYIVSGDLFIHSSTFTGNDAFYGGAIHSENGTLSIHDSSFENSSAKYYGGVIHTSGDVYTMNASFQNNNASIYGGALFAYGNSTLSINNSTFTNNTSNDYGGAIVATKTVEIADTRFNDNNAMNFGGAMSVWGNLSISNSTFVNNSAVQGGAIFSQSNANVSINDSNFTGNSAERYGALYLKGNGFVSNLTFTNNSARTGDAGAIGCFKNLTVINSTFIENSANACGGAVCWSGASASLVNSTFVNNSANNGGAIYSNGSNMNICHSSFTGNGQMEIWNQRALSLENNSISNLIYNNGTIVSPTFIKVLGNSTKISGLKSSIDSTVIVDDNDNLIFTDKSLYLIVLGNIRIKANQESGIWIANYTFNQPGTYLISADNSISGFGNLNVCTGVVIAKKDINLDLSFKNLDYFPNASIEIALDEDARGNVTVCIGDRMESFELNDELNANIKLNISDLEPGDYNISVAYTGDDNYLASSLNSSFTLKKSDFRIFIETENITFGNTATVKIGLPQDFTGNVTVIINGKQYFLDSSTVISLEGLSMGHYDVVAVYWGDKHFNALLNSSSFEVFSARFGTSIDYDDMVTTAVDTDTDGRAGENFTITLKDSTGKALANKKVLFGFNGKIYEKETDANGKAQLQINLKRADIYTFAVCFLGDDGYNGSFAVAKITVNKQKPSLAVADKSYKASAKTKTLTATFKSASGKVVANKKVTFTVNGITYTATTDTNGVATVNVSLNKKGTYSFTAKFAGDNTYAAISKSAKLTIK